jgi:hypothetical protein
MIPPSAGCANILSSILAGQDEPENLDMMNNAAANPLSPTSDDAGSSSESRLYCKAPIIASLGARAASSRPTSVEVIDDVNARRGAGMSPASPHAA